MKKLALSLFMVLFAVGCHAQVTPNPTVYTPPVTTGTAYTPLDQSSPAAGTTYTDSTPPAGTYYYIAQSVITSTNQSSAPSNVAGPFTTSGTNSVDLTWTLPTTGPTPTGVIISRAPAIVSTLTAPTLGTGSVIATSHETSAPSKMTQLATGNSKGAINAPVHLMAKLSGQ